MKLSIPSHFKKTIQKVNRFFDPFLEVSPWYPVELVKPSAYGVQVFVKPYAWLPHRYCLMVEPVRVPLTWLAGTKVQFTRCKDGSLEARVLPAKDADEEAKRRERELAESW
jgi:hypothetical protein